MKDRDFETVRATVNVSVTLPTGEAIYSDGKKAKTQGKAAKVHSVAIHFTKPLTVDRSKTEVTALRLAHRFIEQRLNTIFDANQGAEGAGTKLPEAGIGRKKVRLKDEKPSPKTSGTTSKPVPSATKTLPKHQKSICNPSRAQGGARNKTATRAKKTKPGQGLPIGYWADSSGMRALNIWKSELTDDQRATVRRLCGRARRNGWRMLKLGLAPGFDARVWAFFYTIDGKRNHINIGLGEK